MRYVTNQLFGLLGDAMDDYGVGRNPVNEVSLNGLEGFLTAGLGETVLAVNLPADALNDLLAKTRCRFYPMLRSKIQVMGAKTLLSTRRSTICAEELATLPFVYYNDTTLNCISERIFRHTNLVPNIVYHASNHTKIRTMLRQGEAATFGDTFSSFVQKPSDTLTTCEVIPEINLYFGFFTDEADDEAPSMQYIRQFEAMRYAEFAPYLEKMGCRDLELPIACP